MEAELFHAETDRQTDITKPTDAFRNFANPPKKNPTFFPHSVFMCFVCI
jgi:hypothetical protein